MRIIKLTFLVILILCVGCTDQSLFKKNVGGMAFEIPEGYSSPVTDFTLTPELIQLGYVDGQNYVTDQIIDVATEDDVVYRYGYYSLDDGPWERFILSGREIGSSWILGNAQASLNFHVDSVVTGENNYVITYSCTRLTSSWDCHDRQWQIRNFETEVITETAEQICVNSLGCWYEGVCYETEDYVEAINSVCNFGEWVELPDAPPPIGEPEPRVRVDESVTVSAPLDTPLGSVKNTFTAQDFANGLKDRSIATAQGTSTYSQEISLSSTSLGENYPFGVVFSENDAPNEEVNAWLHIPEGANDPDIDSFFQWSADFNPSLAADVENGLNGFEAVDLDGEILNVMGTDFVIERVSVSGIPSAPSVSMVLLGGSMSDVLQEGETKTYTIIGRDYEVTLVLVDNSSAGLPARFAINGEVTDMLEEGDVDILSDGMIIGVSETILAPEGPISEFFLGAKRIEFRDNDISDDVFSNNVEVTEETIEEGWVRIKGSVGDNNGDGMVNAGDDLSISSIAYRLTADVIVGTTNVYVPEGQSLRSYLDEPEGMLVDEFNIAFVGLTQEESSKIEVYPRGDDEYRIRATNEQGNTYDFPYVEVVNGELRIGEDNTEKLIFIEDEDFTSKIGSLDEGDFTIYPDDKFIVSRWVRDGPSFSHVVEYEVINLTEQVINVTDLAVGTKEFTYRLYEDLPDVTADPSILGEADLILGGNAYKIYVSNFPGNPLVIDLDGDGSIQGDVAEFIVQGGGQINFGSREITQTGALLTLFTPNDNFNDPSSGGEILTMNINQLDGKVSMSLDTYVRNGVDRTTQLPAPNGEIIPTTGLLYRRFAFDPQEPDAQGDMELEMTDYGVAYTLNDPTGGAPETLTLDYPANQVFGEVLVVLGSYE